MAIHTPIEMFSPVEFERELGTYPLVIKWLESYGWTSRLEFGGRGFWTHKYFFEGKARCTTTYAMHHCSVIPYWFLPDRRRGIRHNDSDSETPQRETPQRWIPTSRFLPPVLDLGGTYFPKVEEVE